MLSDIQHPYVESCLICTGAPMRLSVVKISLVNLKTESIMLMMTGCAGGNACTEVSGACDPSRGSLPGKKLAPSGCVHKGKIF